MMLEGLSELSLGALFGRLQASIKSFARSLDEAVEGNKQVPPADIEQLRDHIKERLDSGEEIEDNKKLLKMLDLFRNDRAVMLVIKQDAEEWLAMLDAIEKNLASKGEALDEAESEELEEVRSAAAEVKQILRGDE